MERVIVTAEAEGLGLMLADLVRGNLASHPDRVRLLDGVRGRVNIRARDAGITAGLLFTGSGLSVGSAFERPHLAIESDSDTLLELSNVPLRFGRPDVMTKDGRAVVGKLLTRKLAVRGMIGHPRLMGRLQRLLSVR